MTKPRYLRSILIGLLTTALIIPYSMPAYAVYAEQENGAVEVASDIEEYIDATEPAGDPDPIFGTGRIKVKLELDSPEGAGEAVCYEGSTLLSYGSAAEAEKAYDMLVDKYGAENVVIDMPLLTLESSAKPVGWGVDYMNLDDEKARTTQSSGQIGRKVTVAVIDSGILSSHEIFSGKTISASSKSLIAEGDTIIDEGGHGTEVAGILAEATTDNVELMILKVDKDGESISTETVGQAIRYAADNGADVINLSMSANLEKYMTSRPERISSVIADMEEQLSYAADKGVIICAAAGNDGRNVDEIYAYPAMSENTIAVGAIDKNGQRSSFSNYGSALDFCAPGQEVITASFQLTKGYVFPLDSGTSLATPYVAACCAFVKMNDPAAGNDAAKEALKGISVDLGDAGWDGEYGWGMPKYSEYVKPVTTPSKEDTAKKITSVTINTKTVSAKTIKSAIARVGGKNKYVKQVILGSKVKKISKNAFKGTYVKTIVVKSKKLTKKSVKGSLKSSKVTTIKVKVAKKTATNRKYIKKYKKIFTKKNAGRKPTVKKY